MERTDSATASKPGAITSDLLLRAARGESVERPPVWLMRQAGRILPEYRALRASVPSFKDLVENPELVCEVTLQPVEALGVDAAILFSDILVVPEAMGLPYRMEAGRGPVFDDPIRSTAAIDALRVPDPRTELGYVLEGARRTRSALAGRVPLIGFAGAPWTILAYMVEGSGSKTFSHARALLQTDPVAARSLLDKITETTIAYLNAQVDAGAQALQLFDSWAGVLGPENYRSFALPAVRAIVEGVKASHPEVPLIVFAKDAWFVLAALGELPCDVLGLDWQTDPEWARGQAPGKVFQGNLDPTVLYADPQVVARRTTGMLARFGGKHIANLGHGVYPDTPLQGVRAFVRAVQEYRTPT